MKRLEREEGAVAVKQNPVSSKVFWACIVAFVLIAAFILLNPFSATTVVKSIFDEVSTFIKDIYKELVAISVVIVAFISVVCLLIRAISKNPRTIDEATQWMKRAWICWFLIMILATGFSILKEWSGKVNDASGVSTGNPWDV